MNDKGGFLLRPVSHEGHRIAPPRCFRLHHGLTSQVSNFAGRLLTVSKGIQVQLQPFGIIVIRQFFVSAPCQQGVFPHKDRQGKIIVGFPIPTAAFPFASIQKMRPLSFRQIIFRLAVFPENGRNQKGIAHHVLHIQILHAGLLRKFQNHGPHHGHSRLV